VNCADVKFKAQNILHFEQLYVRFKYISNYLWHTNTHTTVLLLFWNMSGTTWFSRYQKGKTRQVKTNVDLLEQEIVSGSGICWATSCKVCTSSHTTRPRSHHSVFYRPDALSATQPTASKHCIFLVTFHIPHIVVQ